MSPAPIAQDVVKFFDVPQTFLGWVGLAAFAILGIFAVLGWLDRQKRSRERDADLLDDKVIKLLKDQVEALERKVNDQEKQLFDTNTKLDNLMSENKTLRDVLQGRDGDFVEFQRRGLVAMEQASQILALVSMTNRNVEQLYKVIEKHLKAIEEKT